MTQSHFISLCLSFPQLKADEQHGIEFSFLNNNNKHVCCRELQTLRKKKNVNYASAGSQSGCQQLIPWKTFNIIAGRCKYTYFFLQYVEATLHQKLLLWAQLFCKTLKQPGFHKIIFPVSGWDKNSFPHKPRLTMGLMAEELPCLDTAAWYLASLSFMELSDKRGMSRFFLVSALSGLSPGLVSTGYPGKKQPNMNRG